MCVTYLIELRLRTLETWITASYLKPVFYILSQAPFPFKFFFFLPVDRKKNIPMMAHDYERKRAMKRKSNLTRSLKSPNQDNRDRGDKRNAMCKDV